MQARFKFILAATTVALASAAGAQTAGDTARNAANSVGRAASAAVTPGDQDMGRNPNNRSGGLMGNDSTARNAANAAGRAASAAVTPGDQDMGRNPNNRSGGLMGNNNGTNANPSSGTGSTMNGSMSSGDTSGMGTSTRRSGRADRN